MVAIPGLFAVRLRVFAVACALFASAMALAIVIKAPVLERSDRPALCAPSLEALHARPLQGR